MRVLRYICTFVLCGVFVSSCARDLSSNVYTSDSTMNLTLEGKVLSVREVIIKEGDKLSDHKTGALAGAALGGVAGSGVGHSSGTAAAVVGGAVVGGVLGAAAESQLGKASGYEYIIKVDTSKLKSKYFEGTKAMRAAISSATTSGLITVVQGNDVKISEGTPVYVIFSDKRTRVISAR
jgi:outer membrane lipoprotein SlyB